MIYFVNAETKERIEYDDVSNRIFGKNELPVDLNKIGLSMVNMKWERFYAISDPNNIAYSGRESTRYLNHKIPHVT